jgi:hypothetical protein
VQSFSRSRARLESVCWLSPDSRVRHRPTKVIDTATTASNTAIGTTTAAGSGSISVMTAIATMTVGSFIPREAGSNRPLLLPRKRLHTISIICETHKKRSGGHWDPPLLNSNSAWYFYFFTHAFFASSHFMSLVFSQSAFVLGASAANAGAVNAKSIAATIAELTILADMLAFPHGSWGITRCPRRRDSAQVCWRPHVGFLTLS